MWACGWPGVGKLGKSPLYEERNVALANKKQPEAANIHVWDGSISACVKTKILLSSKLTWILEKSPPIGRLIHSAAKVPGMYSQCGNIDCVRVLSNAGFCSDFGRFFFGV